ncbi:MAG: TonB-dependent receptor [Desulfobacterales bacterium]|nr:TonB-dependent receptor [Desulfobacterales bacterium]
MVVITAKDIENMNAHFLVEVLDRLAGIFTSMYSRDFGTVSFSQIQGSNERQVLVLLDGVPWNKLDDSAAEVNGIPLQIINRIEIIKGPASSAWGSSLGGVINILTKPAGETEKPTSSISGSYGEGHRQDFRADTSGRAGSLWYYLYAGYQEATALMDSRFFNNTNGYAKFTIPISTDTYANFTFGTSQPDFGVGDAIKSDLKTDCLFRTNFVTASFDTKFTRNFNMNISLNQKRQKTWGTNYTLGLGTWSKSKELFLDQLSDTTLSQGKIKFSWEKGEHKVIFGIDLEQGIIDKTNTNGKYYQSIGQPEKVFAKSDYTEAAVYINDTINLDKFTITPGLRYNHHDIVGDFFAPSIGATYQIGPDTLFRSLIARGFSNPSFAYTKLPGVNLQPNPDINPETIWSYQAGFETRACPYIWVKSDFFYHEIDDTLLRIRKTKTVRTWINQEDKNRRRGFEIEIETDPFYNISLSLGASYVHYSPISNYGSTDSYTYNLGLKYDDKKSLRAELFGHFIDWDYDPINFTGGVKFADIVIDFSIIKKIYSNNLFSSELFGKVNNIFNGVQYRDYVNPERWVEGGVRFKF